MIFFAIFVLLYEAKCFLNISYLATLDFEYEVNVEEGVERATNRA